MEKINLPLGLATEKGILTWGNVSATTNAVLRYGLRRATTFALDAKDKTFEAAHSVGIKLAEGKFGEIDGADITNVVSVILGLYFAYVSGLVFYRLYLHPLAKFPGYKICAACEWYEFYCYIVKGGQWGNEVRKMHEKYGPIVRTSPWELSVRDPVFYEQLYVTAAKRKTDMWPRGREGNGFDDSHHLSVSHDLHRIRRKHLEPFFSRQGITRIENRIAELVMKMDDRLVGLKGSGAIIPVDTMLCALTGDIIGQVSSGTQAGLLDDPDFTPAWKDLMIKSTTIAPLFRCFPWINKALQSLPSSVMASVYPKGIANMMLGKTGQRNIERIKSEIASSKKDLSGVSVFHHLLSSNIPETEKSTDRLRAESMILLLAGTLAGAHTLTFVVFYVLQNPQIEKQLRAELASVFKDYPNKMPRWTELENLPYLRGTLKEALRLNGLVGNLARCSPDEDILFHQWVIPKKTPVGMSIYAMHYDPSIFSEPWAFKPERWIGKYNPQMDRNFVPFTKGSRSCLGINLAWAEMYLAIAVLFRPGGPKLVLHDADESDIKIARDYIMGFPKADAKDICIKVK
ncbi:cytochrome P450 [Emericellopsis atlantica]|uniref:Cytochrome P450 n=1 Tax=Emericellopsis atlantica TaxID=2614577 RepID=A0A9P8CPA6_9HYPO|nr:cytochrome P450 [Emericellopsis atlantica]KAG9254338.1 cytochrome P450 [Emericellopsis atlantica]